jgi:hypothetical protein
MKLISSFLSVPKRGGLASENEDFFFPHETEITRDRFSVAIADGASEGFLSKLWSRVLAISFVNFDRADLDINQYIDFCIQVYNFQKEKYLQRRLELNNPLKWFEENLMKKGSFSTFLGVSFAKNQSNGGYWKSYSVGDSCVFQIRDSIIDVWPIVGPSTFGNNPNLIATNPVYNRDLEEKVKVKTGQFLFGDVFYFMTDAIASWFITQASEGQRPWRILSEYDTMNDVCDYVEFLRDDHQLKNDDTTIAHVTLEEE